MFLVESSYLTRIGNYGRTAQDTRESASIPIASIRRMGNRWIDPMRGEKFWTGHKLRLLLDESMFTVVGHYSGPINCSTGQPQFDKSTMTTMIQYPYIQQIIVGLRPPPGICNVAWSAVNREAFIDRYQHQHCSGNVCFRVKWATPSHGVSPFRHETNFS